MRIRRNKARTMIAMAKVEAGNVHTGIDELFQLGDLPAGRTDGTNDLGAAVEEGGGLLDGLKLDEAAGQSGYLGCVADHFAGFYVKGFQLANAIRCVDSIGSFKNAKIKCCV